MRMRWDKDQRAGVGRRIRAAAELQGMDTERLAAVLGVGAETVRRHMRGDTLTIEALGAYSAALQVSIDWLLAPATGLEPVTYRFTPEGSAA